MEHKEYDPNDAVDYIYKNAPAYAQAKGRLAELETYKSQLKAIKMKQSSEQSLGAQEREAYASPDYQELCKAIGLATEQAEALRWKLIAAQMRHETWKVEQANQRAFEKMIK